MESVIINDLNGLDELINYLDNGQHEFFVLDVETDSVQEKTAKLYGIGLAFEAKKAFYIPIRDKHENLIWDNDVIEDIKHIITECAKQFKLIGHNIIYDALVIENNWNIRLSDYIYSDTILMKHCIDEDKPFGLKEIAVKYLGPWADKAQKALYDNIVSNGGTVTKKALQMFKADTEVLGKYCCWDVMLTFQLYTHFQKLLEAEGLTDLFYKDEVMPLYKTVTINMKRKGFPINLEHFNRLKVDLEREIQSLEDKLILECPELASIEQEILNEKVPVKVGNTFLKGLYEQLDQPVPTSFAKSKLKSIPDGVIKNWIEGGELDLSPEIILATQRSILLSKKSYQKQRYGFNFKSNDQLSRLLCDKLEYKAETKTPSGKNKIDDKFINNLKGQWPLAETLIDYKKLNKLLATYVDGILDRQLHGVIYTSMLQFGTTSGRYASRNPNMQNCPRIKDEDSGLSTLVLKYANKIREGFVSPPGYSLVNADFSALEMVCFAAACGDPKLIDVFVKGEDLYSSIAINVFGEDNYSADPKAKNFLKKMKPELRNLSKIFTLSTVYGASTIRTAQLMNIEKEKAEEIVEDYLDTYPDLKRYMDKCDYEAKTKGYVKTRFGRVRHLPEAKRLHSTHGNQLLNIFWAKKRGLKEARSKLRNLLNNAKNFPIQGLAAHVVNRAMIATQAMFKKEGLDAHIILQVHDELMVVARDDHAKRAAEILQFCMENTTKLEAPLKAEPLIAKNMAEAK
jgi:DNA polymerase I-like protein with 3'-5' exonuclease and polymerase domains